MLGWWVILDCATQLKLQGGNKLSKWECSTGVIYSGRGRNVEEGKGKFVKGMLKKEW